MKENKNMKTKVKTPKKEKLKTFLIVNDHDGNDSFEVEALNYTDAAHKALIELGWWVAKNEDE